mgnify:CR=1 FL=1
MEEELKEAKTEMKEAEKTLAGNEALVEQIATTAGVCEAEMRKARAAAVVAALAAEKKAWADAVNAAREQWQRHRLLRIAVVG